MFGKRLLESRGGITVEVSANELSAIHPRENCSLSGRALRKPFDSETSISFSYHSAKRQLRLLSAENRKNLRVQSVERIVFASRADSDSIDEYQNDRRSDGGAGRTRAR